jgi:SAM-dependent methyltransferase
MEERPSTGAEADWEGFFADFWGKLGPESKRVLVDLLPEGWSFGGKRVLDFGCGPGRTLQQFLSEAEVGEFWGADIDAPSIERVQRDLCPPLHALRCQADPPLGLEYGSFDLIWAISVFTHLTDNSIPWLLELHRLLKPDGLLIATYIGRFHSELVADEPWDEDRVGMNVLHHDREWSKGGPMVLMSDWWVRAHWGRAFEFLAMEPRVHNQSWALMRKRPVEVTVEEVQRPADDPREGIALRHNLRQVQRELERAHTGLSAAHREVEHLRALVAAREASLQDREASRSWRLTRPLRAAGRVARSLRSAVRSAK